MVAVVAGLVSSVSSSATVAGSSCSSTAAVGVVAAAGLRPLLPGVLGGLPLGVLPGVAAALPAPVLPPRLPFLFGEEQVNITTCRGYEFNYLLKSGTYYYNNN